ncbi:MarR family winged helix-turn-helix transcriptional regulator [Thauera sinica]|uniref:MarR family winged helix-turn-helix transcriptional regulator n=1 Tax=Thauera sinica TaxID=2665146 RepID=A0ABW1ARB2_9RHOO|nr:MarR family transcriptional regulator [Thauera sp. K11]ATE62117.1 MarR family transcriptional regulator [Thauera sp. K11]
MNAAALLLERLGALLHQSVRDDAARHGLLPIHVQVLAYLAQANRYSNLPIAIAEYFGITRGTVSQTLAVLERKGLVTKQADARHGRRVHLTLTPAGEAVLQGSWSHRIDAALGELPLEPQALDAALRALLASLQRLNGQRAFGVCRQCAHFLAEADGARCGLTGERLEQEQTLRICREWDAPRTPSA